MGAPAMETQRKWFALYTKPRQEFKAESQLRGLNIEYYLPVKTELKQWSDRKKRVTEPLLRGYIFIKADETERLQSLELQAIVRCVFDRGRPAVIPELQIENLRAFVREELQYIVFDGLMPGDQVRITAGPMQGVMATVVEEPGERYLAVSIELLNRSVLTRLSDLDSIEIVKTQKQSEKGEENENNADAYILRYRHGGKRAIR